VLQKLKYSGKELLCLSAGKRWKKVEKVEKVENGIVEKGKAEKSKRIQSGEAKSSGRQGAVKLF
jgi:hypothetical protein